MVYWNSADKIKRCLLVHHFLPLFTIFFLSFLLFAVCFFVVYSCYDAINSFLFFGGESSLLSQIYIHIFCLSVFVCVFFMFYSHFAFWLSWTILPNCSLYVLRHYNEKGKNKHSFYHLVCPTSCLYFFPVSFCSFSHFLTCFGSHWHRQLTQTYIRLR